MNAAKQILLCKKKPFVPDKHFLTFIEARLLLVIRFCIHMQCTEHFVVMRPLVGANLLRHVIVWRHSPDHAGRMTSFSCM